MKLFSLAEFPREPGLEIDAPVQPDRIPKNVIFWAAQDAPWTELDDRLQTIVTYLKECSYACDFENRDISLEWQRRGKKWSIPDLLQRHTQVHLGQQCLQETANSQPPDSIFPAVNSRFKAATIAFPLIRRFAHSAGYARLRPDHARFFTLPNGLVMGSALDLHLTSDQNIKYSRKKPVHTDHANAKDFTKLKHLLASAAFQQYPAETASFGCDGCTNFIELNLNGAYTWKCHWGSYLDIFAQICALFHRLARQHP